MDFENLFSKPPNPALGRKQASDSEERTDDEVDDSDTEETQEEKIKWGVKLESEQIPKKVKRFGNSTSPPKKPLRIKSRSKDYDTYSDDDICAQDSEDTFAQELQQYIKAKEMASATQSFTPPEHSVAEEGVNGAQQATKQKNKKSKAGQKNGKQKKMKRKWSDTGDKGSNGLPRKRGSQEEDGKPKEKRQPVMSQGFINQHTVVRKGKQICKYFLERKCVKGDQCKFDHDAEIEKKKMMCKFYVQGYCTRGENCLYLHNEYPCKFYHTGTKCYQGEYCKFSHAPLTDETRELLARVLDAEKK